MCDTMTLQLIENEIKDCVSKQQMFTAFDITKAVRAKSSQGTSVYHHEVRDEVHNLYLNGFMGGYCRSLASLAGVNTQPFIYHNRLDNPDMYGQASFSMPAVIPSNPILVANLPILPTKTVSKNFKTVNVDNRGTLCIPKYHLRSSGIFSGDRVQVVSENGCVKVTKDNIPNFLSTYTVDKYGNVRITQSTLATAGLAGKTYEVALDSNSVIVKKAA